MDQGLTQLIDVKPDVIATKALIKFMHFEEF